MRENLELTDNRKRLIMGGRRHGGGRSRHGELLKVYVFVACLLYSGYMYAEGFYDMKEEAWVAAHVNAFNFFGGSTPILVPDNLKTGIIKNTVAELVVNDQYRLMAEHYGTAVVPARPRKPKDKGAVEMSVGVIER